MLNTETQIGASLTCPSLVEQAASRLNLTLKLDGKNVGWISYINWSFQYKGKDGQWQPAWTTKTSRQNLSVQSTTWQQYAIDHGQAKDGGVVLEMRVEALCYYAPSSDITRLLATSNSCPFSVQIAQPDVTIDGPGFLTSFDEKATFTPRSKANLTKASRVEWLFSYRNKDGGWVDLAAVTRTGFEALVLTESTKPSLEEWFELARQHATGDSVLGRYMTMRVFAKVFSVDVLLVATSKTSTFTVYPPAPKLNLTVSGPDKVTSKDSEVVFKVTAAGDGKDLVDRAEWTFSYMDERGEWAWDWEMYLEKTDLADLKILKATGTPNLTYLLGLGIKYGVARGNVRVLKMTVEVDAYAGETLMAASNVHNFTVEVDMNLTVKVAPFVDVYPTQPNTTTLNVSLGGGGTVRLRIEGALPAYLKASISPDVVNIPHNRGFNTTKLNVTLNATLLGARKLPLEERIRIVAEAGLNRSTVDLTLRLLPCEWLVMLYLCADTDPDLQWGMLYNVLEMCNVSEAFGTPKVGMVVLADFRTAWLLGSGFIAMGISEVVDNDARLYQVVYGNLSLLEPSWGATNMSAKPPLERLIDESVKRFPAKRTQLILADHGAGIEGIDWDFHQGGVQMKIKPLAEALGVRKFDLLSFDACLMAQLEVLYQLRNNADYFTCSERTVPNKGHPYDKMLADLCQKPNMTALDYAKLIVGYYAKRYDGSPGSQEKANFTLSAIDSSKLGDLVRAVDGLADALVANYSRPTATMNATMARVVYRSWEADHRPYTDLGDFAAELLINLDIMDLGIKAAAVEVIYRRAEAVVASNQSVFNSTGARIASDYTGLTIFLWRKGYDYGLAPGTSPSAIYQHFLGFYRELSFARNASWEGFMENFTRSLPADVVALTLLHPGHELYLHVYDQLGRHVGFSQAFIEQSRTGIELGIPGAFYIDFHNGTKALLLPGNLSDFRVVVDGRSMVEDEEPYALHYTLIRDGQVKDAETLQSVIKAGTNHSTSVELVGDDLVRGEMIVEGEEQEGQAPGKELPLWFEEFFPFLVPLVEPFLPYVPSGLVPFVPFLTLAVPVLLVLVVVGVVLRSRRAKGTRKPPKGG